MKRSGQWNGAGADILDELSRRGGDAEAFSRDLEVPEAWVSYWMELARLRRAQQELEESCS